MKKIIANRSERGAALVEYALLTALIALIGIASIRQLGNNLSASVTNTGNGLSDPGSCRGGPNGNVICGALGTGEGNAP